MCPSTMSAAPAFYLAEGLMDIERGSRDDGLRGSLFVGNRVFAITLS